jgi:Family of unknown function (DUF6920)
MNIDLKQQNPSEPEGLRRYQAHALATGACRPEAVRLGMQGEIRIKGEWLPFKAEQWLDPHRGFDWRATVRMGTLRVKGYDRYLQGRGEMRWRMFGLIPMIHESGANVTRSARGRLAAEAIWLPSALQSQKGIVWSDGPDEWLRARWPIEGQEQELKLALGSRGNVERILIDRWGNPDGQGWRVLAFGAQVEAEGTFQGNTIPTRLSAGWWFGTKRFKTDGEFFRVTIETWVPS